MRMMGNGPKTILKAENEHAAKAPGQVLVVDDEPMIRATLERMLQPPHTLSSAGSARKALDLIAAGARFDVILCDLMMPEMNGMDLYQALEKSCPDQARRMVFMTGGAFTSWGTEFLSSILNPQLEKPFSPAQVRTLVAEQLESLGQSRPAGD